MLKYSVWEWGSARRRFPDTSGALRRAMAKNSYLKADVTAFIAGASANRQPGTTNVP